MARRRTIKLAALNIKTEPHSPERYAELWHFIARSHIWGRIRGNDYLLITALSNHNETDPAPLIKGIISKFTEINIHAPWLNLETNERIETEEVEEIVRIPETLKPNLKEIYFVFNPDRHRLIFETNALAPSSMKRAFENIVKDPRVRERYGVVDVELETSRNIIEQIIRLQNIRKLEIQISRPNPDGISHLRQSVFRRMDNQNIRHQQFKAITTHPDGIQPDDETMDLIRVSQSDGKTIATVIIDDMQEVLSTDDHPFIKLYRYDPDLESLSEAVVNGSYDYMDSIE